MQNYELYAHQSQAIEFLKSRNGIAALFADMGLGKTLIALEYFKFLRSTAPSLKMIVCAPLSILEAAWGCDIRRFTSFTYYNANGRGVPGTLKEDILLINYEAMILARNKGITDLIKGNLLVADESSRMKSNTAKTTKTLHLYGQAAKYRIVMTATPAPNTPMEYWGQVAFLKTGVLHRSFYGFRNNYFHLQRGKQIMRGSLVTRQAMYDALRSGFTYEITDTNLKKLMQRIAPLSLRLKKEDCLDLPEQVDEVRFVHLNAAVLRHYLEMKRHLITEIKGQTIVAEVALTKLMKLQQIISGWCYSAGKVVEIKDGDCKTKELLCALEEIADKQVIIWCRFQEEIRRLMAILPGACTLYGETKDREDSINGFKEGWYKYLIANTHSAGHGLTFTNCSYQVFYSLDFSWEAYVQAKARIHRIGTVNKCTYIHLLAKDTIDEDIYATLQRKGSMVGVIERMLKNE